MRKTPLACLVPFLCFMIAVPCARASIRIDLSIRPVELEAFYAALSAQYQVQKSEILTIRALNMSDEDLPVIFHLAAKASVSPREIVKLRLHKLSWLEIAGHFGLTAEIFHVPVTKEQGPPFGEAYGRFKIDRTAWGTIRLTDREAAHLAHLKFASEVHECPPDQVLALHVKGQSFVKVHLRIEERDKARRDAAGAESSAKGGDRAQAR